VVHLIYYLNYNYYEHVLNYLGGVSNLSNLKLIGRSQKVTRTLVIKKFFFSGMLNMFFHSREATGYIKVTRVSFLS
jgi:hypothetical protein